jgi:hypothetical protein
MEKNLENEKMPERKGRTVGRLMYRYEKTVA